MSIHTMDQSINNYLDYLEQQDQIITKVPRTITFDIDIFEDDYIKIQNGRGLTDTEYENTSEDASGTFRERDVNAQESSRMRDSRDYGSLNSSGEEENSHIKQLREMIRNLGVTFLKVFFFLTRE